MKISSTPQKHRRAGTGHLHSSVDKALLRSLLIELAKNGYARLSLGAVARRAGAGKAAIYRRWSGKEEMVTDTLLNVGIELVTIEDTGDLYGDLHTYVSRTVELLSRPLARKILPDLYAELTRDTPLAERLRDTVQAPKQEIAKGILRRAIQRGELDPELDLDMALDMMIGPLYWRLVVTQSKVDCSFADKYTVALLRAWKAKPQ